LPWRTYCPKWSSGGFAIMIASRLYEHKSVKPTLTLESFEYFKINEDLKEVAIIKSVPNWIPHSHKWF
jgi:hypothetical protein